LNQLLATRWRDVAQVFEIERSITWRGVTRTSYAYGLTSLTPEQAPAAQLLRLVRAHWMIENRCHWRRDATLGEDRCKVASPRAAATLAALNSAILALAHLLKAKNLRALLRRFAAKPAAALSLILKPLRLMNRPVSNDSLTCGAGAIVLSLDVCTSEGKRNGPRGPIIRRHIRSELRVRLGSFGVKEYSQYRVEL
jgi:hypothetical protein